MPKLIKDLVSVAFAIIMGLLVVRFVLKLLGANPAAGLASWVYTNTEPLLAPFAYMFPIPTIDGTFVLEFTTLFALFAYAVLAYIVQEILAAIIK